MQIRRNIPNLNHSGHAISIVTCKSHVNEPVTPAHYGQAGSALPCWDAARCCRAVNSLAVPHRRAHKARKKRMRREGLRFELRVELAAEEPGMVRHFDNFDV